MKSQKIKIKIKKRYIRRVEAKLETELNPNDVILTNEMDIN